MEWMEGYNSCVTEIFEEVLKEMKSGKTFEQAAESVVFAMVRRHAESGSTFTQSLAQQILQTIHK